MRKLLLLFAMHVPMLMLFAKSKVFTSRVKDESRKSIHPFFKNQQTKHNVSASMRLKKFYQPVINNLSTLKLNT
jgi:hypothetical protein